MTIYDSSKPATSNQALDDVTGIKSNLDSVRDMGSSLAASPPANPVAGQFWWVTDTKVLYQRNSTNTTWLTMWTEEDAGHGPAWYHTSAFDSSARNVVVHYEANITSANTVHGIKQGTGGLFDADLLDGQEGVWYLAASHGTTAVNVHGLTGTLETTAGAQAKVDAESADISSGVRVLSNPSVVSFQSAQHNHQDAAGGGALTNSIATTDIQDGAITTAKLAASAVTIAKMSMTQGSWSYYKGSSSNQTAVVSLNRYAHSVKSGTNASVGAIDISFGLNGASTGYSLRCLLTDGTGGVTYTAKWDYHN